MQPLETSHTRAIAVMAVSVAIGVFHFITPLRFQHWHDFLQHLYFFPVVYAGLTFGWRGGLLGGAFVALIQIPHILETWASLHTYAVGQLLEMPLFGAAGMLTGLLVERERKQRAELARTTARLSEVYGQLQENFDQMKRAERLYAAGQLAAGLAHEIRNPLASIAGGCGILQRNARLEETHLKVLAVIDKECQRLSRLLSAFLDFARPREPKRQAVDIALLLQSVTELARHAVGTKAVVLRHHVPTRLPPLVCDPEMISQLLLNLAINAIQASPDGGAVTLSASVVSGNVCLSVRDEGCGISPENRDKIFDPFFTTKQGGTGLGLSVAHQIVEQHGGRLSAEANPEKGTTFIAILPLACEASK